MKVKGKKKKKKKWEGYLIKEKKMEGKKDKNLFFFYLDV